MPIVVGILTYTPTDAFGIKRFTSFLNYFKKCSLPLKSEENGGLGVQIWEVEAPPETYD